MLIQINHLSAGYLNRKNATMTSVIALDRLDIACGQHTLLLGPSGCGKTTLLNILACLARPITGDVTIDSVRVDLLSEAKRDHFRGQKIGLVMQRLHLIAALTVSDNLLLAQRLAGAAKDHAAYSSNRTNRTNRTNNTNSANSINVMLEKLGIAHKAKSYPRELSQGEAQRVAIARAVLNKPLLVLADEPTSALDDHHAEAAISLLFEQAEEHGATLIVATHDARIKSRFAHIVQLGQRA